MWKAPKIKEYEVSTYVDDWREVSIKHKMITYKFIKKWLIPELLKLPFVEDILNIDKAYPLRIKIKEYNNKVSSDICLFNSVCTNFRRLSISGKFSTELSARCNKISLISLLSQFSAHKSHL